VIVASRFHDFSAGHRVLGHESKCAYLHGHNYRVHFDVTGEEDEDLDAVGRVIDFAVINTALCQWLETHWDHHLLINLDDPWLAPLRAIDSTVVAVPFNPTAENMAAYLVEVIGPARLEGTGVRLVRCCIEETRKCSATVYR
jgi:6-pyruvoyltetrahydropterin/6-carboxytetrahydropterin synthase